MRTSVRDISCIMELSVNRNLGDILCGLVYSWFDSFCLFLFSLTFSTSPAFKICSGSGFNVAGLEIESGGTLTQYREVYLGVGPNYYR